MKICLIVLYLTWTISPKYLASSAIRRLSTLLLDLPTTKTSLKMRKNMCFMFKNIYHLNIMANLSILIQLLYVLIKWTS